MNAPYDTLHGISQNDILVPGLGRSAAGHDHEGAFDSPNLRVSVIATTEKGTAAALRAASDLAKGLAARITLVSVHVIPLQFSLENPPVSVSFLQKQLSLWVSAAGANPQDVAVQLWLCRDEEAALRQVLAPRSLLVIGGAKHWWGGREERLERFLTGLGHQVIFMPSKGNREPAIRGKRGLQRAFHPTPKGRATKTKVA